MQAWNQGIHLELGRDNVVDGVPYALPIHQEHPPNIRACPSRILMVLLEARADLEL